MNKSNLKRDLIKILLLLAFIVLLYFCVLHVLHDKIPFLFNPKMTVIKKFNTDEELENFILNDLKNKYGINFEIKLEDKKQPTLYKGWLDGGIGPYTIDGLYDYDYLIYSDDGFVYYGSYRDPYYNYKGEYKDFQLCYNYHSVMKEKDNIINTVNIYSYFNKDLIKKVIYKFGESACYSNISTLNLTVYFNFKKNDINTELFSKLSMFADSIRKIDDFFPFEAKATFLDSNDEYVLLIKRYGFTDFFNNNPNYWIVNKDDNY